MPATMAIFMVRNRLYEELTKVSKNSKTKSFHVTQLNKKKGPRGVDG